MRVALDSNVLVSALVGHSHPRRLLFQLLRGHVILSSMQMLVELEEVLQRKKFKLTRGQVEEYLKLVINGSHLIIVTVCPEARAHLSFRRIFGSSQAYLKSTITIFLAAFTSLSSTSIAHCS
jgi:predicted nucleic acid-binding protein